MTKKYGWPSKGEGGEGVELRVTWRRPLGHWSTLAPSVSSYRILRQPTACKWARCSLAIHHQRRPPTSPCWCGHASQTRIGLPGFTGFFFVTTWFRRVCLEFTTGFLPSFVGFYRFPQIVTYWVLSSLIVFFLMDFKGFYLILLDFMDFSRVLGGFVTFYRVVPGFTGYDWVFTEFHRVLPLSLKSDLLGFIWIYWVLSSSAVFFKKNFRAFYRV